MRRDKRNSDAWAISDRSGFRFPMREMVVENNGLLVHRSESDGQWSDVKHPLNNIGKYLHGKTGDPYPVINARPDRKWAAYMVYPGSVDTGAGWYVNAIGIRRLPATSSITGTASFSAIGRVSSGAFSSIVGTASMSVTSKARRTAFVSITGTASVAVINSTKQGSVAITAGAWIPYSSSDSGDAYKIADGTTDSLIVAGGVTASARIVSFATATINGSATVAVTSKEYYRASVAITGTASMSVSGTVGTADMQNGVWITTPGTSARKVPSGVTSLTIEIAGAGGGGRFSTGSTYYGGAGGGAYLVEFGKSVIAGTDIAFTVGSGGLGAVSVSSNGSDGGNTVCDGMTARGGKGVTSTSGAAGGTFSDPGGLAGLASNGSNGGNGTGSATGAGGNSSAGGVGGTGVGANTPGNNGTVRGGGGSSAGPTNTTPGNGANGGIKFSW